MRTLASSVGVLVLLAGCSGGSSGPTDEDPTETGSRTPGSTAPTTTAPTSTPPTSSATARAGTEIVVEPSDFGPMLFDSTGQAIYLFDVETSTEPRCYDACAAAWPPVFAKGEPVAGDGVRPGLLGTTKRTDGRRQVTYGGHPLYFYAHEGKREVLCHDVFLNGGNWYVVQPDGSAAPPG